MAKFIIGIDAGFTSVGWVIRKIGDNKYIKYGVITTQPNHKKRKIRIADDDVERIKHITRELTDVYQKNIGIYDEIMVVAEMPTGGSIGARANRCMGIATAIIVTFFEMYNHPIEVVQPSDVKYIATKSVSASKEMVMEKAYDTRLFKEQAKAKFEHIADAYFAIEYAIKKSDLYRVFVGS